MQGVAVGRGEKLLYTGDTESDMQNVTTIVTSGHVKFSGLGWTFKRNIQFFVVK